MLQVLVDADNVAVRRVQPVLDLLAESGAAVTVVASGHPAALRRLHWPASARLIEHVGWQRADLALAEAYSADEDPLMVVSGDGDFALLAARHPGPVLVVSGSPSARLRAGATVLDPAIDGLPAISAWLAAFDAGGRDR